MLKELISFCEKNNGNLYVYGAGLYGKRLGVWLDENGYDWKGFIETKKTSEMALDKPISEYNTLLNEIKGAFIVCVNAKHQDEIVATIRKSGKENYIIVSSDQVGEIDKANSYSKEYSINKYVNVLLYHRVIDLDSDPQLLAVDVDRFDEHIRCIKDNYRIIRFDDDWRDVKEKSIVITFDDGYADNYLYALPILEKYKVPATIFVSTENLDTTNEMWWDELEALILLNNDLPEHVELLGEFLDLSTKEAIYNSYLESHRILKALDADMRRAELKKLQNKLAPHDYPRTNYRLMTSHELKEMSKSEFITIGGHTVTHSCLANQSLDKQKWEIEKSKAQIESIIGKMLEVFSYPFGSANDYTNDTADIVGSVGYKKAGIVKDGLAFNNTDAMRIPRNLIRNLDMQNFEKRLREIWSLYG